jgi:hypothetical protein
MLVVVVSDGVQVRSREKGIQTSDVSGYGDSRTCLRVIPLVSDIRFKLLIEPWSGRKSWRSLHPPQVSATG